MKYESDPMVRVEEYLKLYRGFSKGIRRVYASEYFNCPLSDFHDQMEMTGLNGDYELTLWCIDETHTNPYTRMQRDGMQEDQLSQAQIEILRQEGHLKPMHRQILHASGSVCVDLQFTNNACVLVELKKQA